MPDALIALANLFYPPLPGSPGVCASDLGALVGPSVSGRSSLVFAHLCHWAAAPDDDDDAQTPVAAGSAPSDDGSRCRGRKVLYLARRERVEQRCGPRFLDGRVPPEDVLAQIQVKYVHTAAELVAFLANMHRLPDDELPAAIGIDDFSQLLTLTCADQQRQATTMLIFALLKDAVAHCRQRIGRCTALLVYNIAETDAERPRKLALLRRWLPAVIRIRPTPGGRPGADFCLELDDKGSPMEPSGACVHYTLSRSAITVSKVRHARV